MASTLRHFVGFLVLAALCLPAPVAAQQIHRNGFESRETFWVKGASDAPHKDLVHAVTQDFARGGQQSEFIQHQFELGSHLYYSYDVGRAPIAEELSASVHIKANRPGIQLLARLVLPKERNGDRLDEPLTTLLRGDIYQQAGRWQRLELRRPTKLVKDQLQLLRTELRRDVDLTGAYLDRLILNVYAGPGQTDVHIDDLEIGPVLEAQSPFRTASRAREPKPTAVPLRSPGLVALRGDKLTVGDKRFFFRAIRHTDTPFTALREAGFNTLWLGESATAAQMEEAVNLGFWVVPSLNIGEGRLDTPEALNREVARYLAQDGVLFWELGPGSLAAEDAARVGQAAQLVHAADPQRPVAADVYDGFGAYHTQSVDLLGVRRWPVGTSLELPQYRAWLNQRRLLAPGGAFFWTWVQTHMPDWYTKLVFDRPGNVEFPEAIGPQPEQVRLVAYTALSAGVQGLGFWSDRFLADSHQGRDRLLAVALLNQELQMLEPLLVTAGPPRWVDTSLPQVKAAVMHAERGVLVLPIWVGPGAQYVPGQAAAAKLTLVVPDVPAGTEAWEVTPADVRALRSERVPGGRRLTLPEFGLTAAVVFTADNGPNGLLVRLQEQARRLRKTAAQWSYALAETEMNKVAKVEAELEQAGHIPPDAAALLANARLRLGLAGGQYEAGDYRESYLESQRALRPLRILMRAQWEEAVREVDNLPVASPFAVSFYTLPRHWAFVGRIKAATVGANALVDGSFEAPIGKEAPWLPQEVTRDEVQMSAQRVPADARDGKQCLMLQVLPKDPQKAPKALERTFLAVNSPPAVLPPGTLVQVSGWIRVPQEITASADGVLLYDSAGGEPLAVRVTGATDWKKFTLYRTVPVSGQIRVTLALTGLGTVFFDDVRVEPLVAGPTR